MSNSQPSRDGGFITLSDDARAALHDIVEWEATSVGEAIEHADDSTELERAIVRATLRLTLMRAAETGRIARADVEYAAARVKNNRDQCLEGVEGGARDRRRFLAGDDGYGFCGRWYNRERLGRDTCECGDEHRERTLAEYQQQIDRQLEEIADCNAFLTETAGAS